MALLTAFASSAFGQAGPNCNQGIVSLYSPNVYTLQGEAAESTEGPELDDCSFAVTALHGQKSVTMVFNETFHLCYLDSVYCPGSVTATLTANGTILDTTAVSGNGATGPTADSDGAWTISSDGSTYTRAVTRHVDVSTLTATADATLQWEIDATQGYEGPFSVRLTLYPADSNLLSFDWSYPSNSTPAPMFPMYYDSMNAGWQADPLADEGDTLVTQPRYVASSGENDPACYSSGATPVVFNVGITRPDSFSGNATLRIEEANGLLAFPDSTVPFTSGSASYGYAISSSQALPASIANLQPQLTWSLSIDGGATFIPFAWTSHNVFVTLGPPSGSVSFPSPDGYTAPSFPHVTAARVNYVTSMLNGLASPDPAAQMIQTVDYQYLFDFGDGTLDQFADNPWQALDSAWGASQPPVLDCYSQTAIGAVQLFEVGVSGIVSVAFPTTDGDATAQEHQNYQQTGQEDLIYYGADGVTGNRFEAFLELTQSSPDAYTFFPALGPLYPWMSPTVAGMPSTDLGQLAFQVIYTELGNERHGATNSQGGQQWWVYSGTANQAQGRVAFPVSIP